MVVEILLSKIDSDSPIITFSGVLISCDTLARKSVFALLAASAFLLIYLILEYILCQDSLM